MKTIEPEELQVILSKADVGVLLVDVRDEKSYGEGHIPGSLHIPIDLLSDNLEKLKEYTTIYVTCGGGTKSGRAYDTLSEAGVEVVRFQKGFRGWRDAGYPIEQ